MLEASNLECVRGERRLFAGVGFRLEGGEMLFLQGRNGSGKTTLLRMICGLTHPVAGEIRWKGETIGQLGEEFREELCYLGHLNAIKEELTPLENLTASAKLAGETLTEDEALDALEAVGLAGREDLACKYLSQGQKRRAGAGPPGAREARPVGARRAFRGARRGRRSAWLAGLIGVHLQRGGMVVLTTHQAVDIPAGQVRELKLHDRHRRRCHR